MMVDSVLEAVHPATIDAALLSQAVTKVGECQISYGQPGQLEAILGAVSEAQDLALKTLFLGGGVVQVSPELLGTAAVKLTRLEVGDVTSGQVGEILTRVAVNEDSKLREFRILGQNLAENVRNTDISRLMDRIRNFSDHILPFLRGFGILEKIYVLH